MPRKTAMRIDLRDAPGDKLSEALQRRSELSQVRLGGLVRVLAGFVRGLLQRLSFGLKRRTGVRDLGEFISR
jgi:hypothetical protein